MHPGVVRAAPTLPGVSRIRLPPASPGRCDGQEAKVSHLRSTSDAAWRTWASAQSMPQNALKILFLLIGRRDLIPGSKPGPGHARSLMAGLEGPTSHQRFVTPAHRQGPRSTGGAVSLPPTIRDDPCQRLEPRHDQHPVTADHDDTPGGTD